MGAGLKRAVAAAKATRAKPTLKLVCSRHGERPFVAFSHASIYLGCGCSWTHSSDKLKWEDSSKVWFVRDFLGLPRMKKDRP